MKEKIEIYPSKRFGTSVTSSPPSEEASATFVGAELFFRCVELSGREFFGSSFVRYYAFLDFLIISPDTKDLPGTNDPVVQRIDHVENVTTSETHFTFIRLFVVEVSPGKYFSVKTKNFFRKFINTVFPKKLAFLLKKYTYFTWKESPRPEATI